VRAHGESPEPAAESNRATLPKSGIWGLTFIVTSATLICEYSDGMNPVKEYTVDVWVTQDFERINRILQEFKSAHTDLKAESRSNGERVRIVGTVESHAVLHQVMVALPNKDLTADLIEMYVTCQFSPPLPTEPACCSPRFFRR
jgi:hypothetical protein